jgi:methylated-DNA-[protein]-cysteine S-methyltransferase
MPNAVRYVIFSTRWGYFGLAATEAGLLRTWLPMPRASRVKSLLLDIYPSSHSEKGLLRPLQEQVTAYFEGAYVDFDKNIPILLEGFSPFARSVLAACRRVRYGRTISYGQLAVKAGAPNAAKAIGGVPLKKRMLEIERHALKV